MTISFDIPNHIERLFAGDGGDPSLAVKEAALVELFRQGKLGHSELANALGLSRYETDGVLKRHGVLLDLPAAQIAADVEGLRGLVGR